MLFFDEIIKITEFGRKVSLILKKTNDIVKWLKSKCVLRFLLYLLTGIILTGNVISFLQNEENAIHLDEVIFVHDKALCMQVNQTQHLFRDYGVKF